MRSAHPPLGAYDPGSAQVRRWGVGRSIRALLRWSEWSGRDLFGRKQPEERELRSLIVSELEAPEKEFSYVIAFYLLCVRNFKDLPGPAESRIRFLAAAYNTGFWKNREEIEKTAEMKFYSTKLVTKEYYSYCDVAIFWYRNHYQAHPAN